MKRNLLVLFSLIVSMTLTAGNVTEQEALKKAQQFLQGRSFQQKDLRRAATENTFAQGAFYVFNADGDQGFVIVSADDRTESILGYADAGSLDLNHLPKNAAAWLQSYASQIKSLGEHVNLTAPHRAPGTEKVLLETAKYNQEAPYNGMCPSDKGGQCVTGCVATAMAIVMQYNKWPKSVGIIDGYSSDANKYRINMPDLPATTFDYNHLKMTYEVYNGKKNYTDEDSVEVAKLMLYCGQAVNMTYSSDVSNANVYVSNMVKTFNFSPSAQQIERHGYTDEAWQKLIYDEMVAKRVVLYGGTSETSGHEFVIDGYDGNGLFHVNWGWGGYCDGYFSLATLNAEGKGVSGYNVDNGYSMGQDAIIGLKPKADGDITADPIVYAYCDLDKNDETGEYTRDSESEDFQNIRLRTYFSFTGIEEKLIYYKVEAWKDGKCADLVVGTNSVQLHERKYWGRTTTTAYFGADLADGVYELRVFYRFEDTEEWKEPLKARYTSGVYATIEGNLLKLSSTSARSFLIEDKNWKGDCVVGRPMEATIKWTRPVTNDFEENNFYLWIEGDEYTEDALVAGMTSYIAKGETEELTFSFKPTHTGECRVYLTADGYGDEVIDYELFTIDVKDMQKQRLDLKWYEQNIKQNNDKEDILYSNEFHPEISIKNEGENDYDDDIVLILTPVDDKGNPIGEKVRIGKKAQVSAGGEGSVKADFTGLENGKRYMFQGYHYTNENKGKTYFKYIFRNIFTVNTSTGINTVKTDEKAETPVYNLKGQRVDNSYKGLVIKNGKKYVVK